MSDLPTGTELGPWVVSRTLHTGRTHLVEVHAHADDTELRTLQLFSKTQKSAQGRFDNHQRVMQAVDSPHLPELQGTGESEHHLFLVYPHFASDPLSFKMTEQPPWGVVAAWLFAISSGLAHLHARGWTHRGLTPDTVFIADDGRLWLLGMDAATDDERRRAHLPKRSMAYVAPEVLGGQDHDATRADQYAFGCLAFEALTREPAFPAATWVSEPDPQLALRTWKSRATALDPGSDHPSWLRSMVRKCTHPDPQHRLPDIDTVVGWLDASRQTWFTFPPPSAAQTLPMGDGTPLVLRPALIRDEAAPAFDPYDVRGPLTVFAGVAGVAAGVTLAALTVLWLEVTRLL